MLLIEGRYMILFPNFSGLNTLVTTLKETLQSGSHTQNKFNEFPWACRRTCETCTKTGYAELTGDGMATCLVCGEEDIVGALSLHD
jgi:hypothetical protein